MWFDSADAYNHYIRSPKFAAARDDEGAFLDRSRTVVMPVDVHVIKDGPVPDDAVKNIEFVNRRPGTALEPFRSYWRNIHGPLAAKIPVIRRYEQNHLALSAELPDRWRTVLGTRAPVRCPGNLDTSHTKSLTGLRTCAYTQVVVGFNLQIPE